MDIGRVNGSTRRKPAPVTFWSAEIPHDLTLDRTRTAAVGSRNRCLSDPCFHNSESKLAWGSNLWKKECSCFYIFMSWYIEGVQGGKLSILGGHSMIILSMKVYMYMCPIPNSFRDRVISLYSSKFVDTLEYILHARTIEPQEQPLLSNTRMQQ
jgi:hypothetical protein